MRRRGVAGALPALAVVALWLVLPPAARALAAAPAQQAEPAPATPAGDPPLEIRRAAPATPDGEPPSTTPAGDPPLEIRGAAPATPDEEPPPDERPAAPPTTDPAELFVKANAAYDDGRYAEAAELYGRLPALGVEDGRIYHNLGNAYLRNRELGRAIAAYRQGLVLRPRDEDLRANLAFARRSTKDAIAPPEPSPVLATLFFWHYGLSPREIAAAALAVNLLFWGVWMVRLFRRDSETLRWLFLLLLVLLVATAGSLLARRLLPQTLAVIVPQQVEARTAPDEASVVRFQLQAGSEVRVEDERADWVRIALPDGQQGWIRRDDAALVRG